MSAHTPGPWKRWTSNQHPHSPTIIYTGDIAPYLDADGLLVTQPGKFICEVMSDIGHMDDADNWIAHDNASLIAAAPELLEAIEWLLNALPSATAHPAIKSARNAMAKAKGGAA